MPNFNFKKLFIVAGLVIVIGTLGITGLFYWILTPKRVESRRPLTPTIKLVLEDNKVDTIYVYTQP